MNLEDNLSGRNNNLNIIRFIAALFVIYSHSFPITGNGLDYLNRLTDGQIDFGGVAVSIFFFYGGFLICKSVQRTRTAKDFFKARILRIIPPLALVTFFLALIVGPFLTKLSVAEYYTNAGTYKYLLNSVFILFHNLPGVFEDNPFNPTVNGPLWTLPVEFLCYIMCFVLYKLKLLEKKKIIIISIPAFVIYGVVWNFMADGSLIRAAIRPAVLFLVGMICYIYKDLIPIKPIYGIVALLLCVVSCVFGFFNVIIFVCFTYFLLWIGFGTKIKLSAFGSKHEMSYGMYLIGWPIQQVLCVITHNNISQFMNFIIAACVSVVFGFLISLFEKQINKTFKENKRKENL